MNGLKALGGQVKSWHLIVLASLIVVTVVTAVVYIFNPLGLNPFASDESDGLAPTERLIPVRVDSLTTEISINGGITFSNKEDLTFGSPGFVDEILVSEGEIVSEGQLLARLDPESVANLRRAIAEAQLEHEDALDALADAQMPALQIAEAEAALATAELDLQNAQSALDELVYPDPQVVAQLESAFADSELELQNAQEALDETVNPSAEAIAAAEETIAQAQVALRDSEHSLANDYLDAIDDLDAAERDLAAASLNLHVVRNSNDTREARETFDQERKDYFNVIKKWTGAEPTVDELSLTPDALFAAMEFDPEEVYSRKFVLFPDGRIADNPETRWNELTIFAWRGLYPGTSLIEVSCNRNTLRVNQQSDTTNTNRELCIGRDMDNAFDALDLARKSLSATVASYGERLSNAEAAVESARLAVEAAENTRDNLEKETVGDELLQKQFAAARENLNRARQDLEDLLNADAVEVASLRNKLTLAQANRDDAAYLLNTLLNPGEAEVAVLLNEVAVAQARRDRAAQDLQEIHDRRALQIALQEATVAAAQAKIAGAMRRYEDSTLKAPWDGYISSIPVETGQDIESFEVILTVINSGIVNVEGSVDEIDVLSLKRESPVTVTIDALPDQMIEGIITNISSTATNEQGVVTFEVAIEVVIPEDVTLQEGLSAVARAVAGEERGIVIPLQAVSYGDEGAYVRMQDESGAIIQRPVTLGSSDGFFAIVEDGLSEGERIVMQVLDDSQLEDGGQFRFRGSGGGRPPGGGAGGRPPQR